MNKFRVLLVYPNLQMVNLLPSNIAILSACLKQAGIEVRLFDTTLYRVAEKSVDEIRVEHMQLRPFNLSEKGVAYKDTDIFSDFQSVVGEFVPHVIAVSVTDSTYDLGVALIAALKEKKSFVIFGGVYPTFAPEEAILDKNIDALCIGEGEEALVELCRNMEKGKDIRGIRNLWVKDNGKIYKNPLRPLVDINALAFDDFTVFEDKRFLRPMQGEIFRMIPVTVDRGCPFSCAFCAALRQKQLYQNAGYGSYFRSKKSLRVIDELKVQIKAHRADYIYFNSETFFSRSEREIQEFAGYYVKEIGLPFWCQTHIETINEERIRILEQMHCDRISVGIEQGNEEFRRKMLKKNFSNKQVRVAFDILEKSRIPVTVNNIIGFPDETRELVFDTVRLNRSIHADSINAFFFVPYSGTPLRQYCIEKGYLDPALRADSLMRGSILRMPQFPPEQILGMVRTFPLYVKMPESFFEKIKRAERLDAEGDAVLEELRKIYFQDYFS